MPLREWSGNAGLSFRYRRFNTRLLWNYRGSFLSAYSTDPAQLFYTFSRTTLNASFEIHLTRAVTLFCELPNLFQQPQKYYRYTKSRTGQFTDAGFAATFGFHGQF